MTVYAIKCTKPMVVASDKTSDFLSQKGDPSIEKRIMALAQKFTQNPNTNIQL